MTFIVDHDWFLVGPTAAGKSAVGVELARRIGAEIVSLDSMAVYRRMDIGTAKPTPAERAAVPHHLVDWLEPWQECSLALYLEAAHAAVAEIRARGRQVLFVGGTPLYLKGLLRGIFAGPPADWDFRRRLADEAAREPAGWLHRQVAAVDPAAAARIAPADSKRLIRALEVFDKTGTPISRWQQQFESGRPAAACRVFALDWPRPVLHRRIDARVRAMFVGGLVNEVRGLLALARPLSRTAAQAVGYREVIERLARGSPPEDAAAEVALHTRQLAKRQRTWFSSLSECRFVPMAEEEELPAVARRIAAAGGPGGR